MSGRGWVKRDFGFWHRCIVDHFNMIGTTVVLDNMEELCVAHHEVSQFALEKGELVFVAHWDDCISGNPAFIVSTKGESAEVEYPAAFFGESEKYWIFLRDLRVYGGIIPTVWQAGTAVYAYQARQFDPPLYLLFPAVVQTVHENVCVEVEFEDGETAFVPTTLVEERTFSPGDIVFTCTSYLSHEIDPIENWSPCVVEKYEDDLLHLRDEFGERFEAATNKIAVLPKGFRMFDGKLERISTDAVKAIPHAPTESSNSSNEHITRAAGEIPNGRYSEAIYVVKTDDWRAAETDPITKKEVEKLVASDCELSWIVAEGKENNADNSIQAGVLIQWNGDACFQWYQNGIKCAEPNPKILEKMIDIAIELDANVIGHNGEEYH